MKSTVTPCWSAQSQQRRHRAKTVTVLVCNHHLACAELAGFIPHPSCQKRPNPISHPVTVLAHYRLPGTFEGDQVVLSKLQFTVNTGTPRYPIYIYVTVTRLRFHPLKSGYAIYGKCKLGSGWWYIKECLFYNQNELKYLVKLYNNSSHTSERVTVERPTFLSLRGSDLCNNGISMTAV